MRALLAVSLLLIATPALADECPPGSLPKAENGYSFCEPTVCNTDDDCKLVNEGVCRPIALCMQVGSLDVDAALMGKAPDKRLVVTQACGPDKSCPQATTCSDKQRCVARAQADRMGILAQKTPEAAPAPPAKRSCGCGVVGAPASGGLAALAVGLTILGARARRARSRRAR